MSKAASDQAELWVITTFFNPNGYRSKAVNFDRFRKNIAAVHVPLLVVECTFKDAKPELSDDAATRVIRCQTDSILWQKERLLNVALDHLPDTCTDIAWIDADIIFQDRHWPRKTVAALEQYKVIQLFDKAIRLEPTTTVYCDPLRESKPGFVSHYLEKKQLTDEYDCECGFAWAAKRSILDGIGFYDTDILGVADWRMCKSFFGYEQTSFWSKKAYEQVQGSVSFIRGTILHLYHGNVHKRAYDSRGKLLRDHHFDPESQITINETGALELVHASASLKEGLKNYFTNRDEDEPLPWNFLRHWYWWLEVHRISYNPFIQLQIWLKDTVGHLISYTPKSVRRFIVRLTKTV